MEGSEIERLASLETEVRGMRSDLSELKGEVRTTFVSADYYKSAHESLEDRVNNVEKKADRPSWFVATIIGLLTTSNAALLTGLIVLLTKG